MKYKAKASDQMKGMLERAMEGTEESSVLREPEAADVVERVRDGLICTPSASNCAPSSWPKRSVDSGLR